MLALRNQQKHWKATAAHGKYVGKKSVGIAPEVFRIIAIHFTIISTYYCANGCAQFDSLLYEKKLLLLSIILYQGITIIIIGRE